MDRKIIYMGVIAVAFGSQVVIADDLPKIMVNKPLTPQTSTTTRIVTPTASKPASIVVTPTQNRVSVKASVEAESVPKQQDPVISAGTGSTKVMLASNSKPASESITWAPGGVRPQAAPKPGQAITVASSPAQNDQSLIPPGMKQIKETIAIDKKGGSLPGINRKISKPVTLSTSLGMNEMIQVSNRLPNQITVPFTKPEVIDISSIEYIVKDNVIYLQPTGTEPVGIYIHDKDHPGAGSISLTLLPRDLPGQNVYISVDNFNSSKAKEDIYAANDYIEYIKVVMRAVGKGQVPDSFVMTEMEKIKSVMGPIAATSSKRLSGSSFDLFSYELQNTSENPITLSEQSFYQKRVRAVAFWPHILLTSGQKTTVWIMVGKDEFDLEGERLQ